MNNVQEPKRDFIINHEEIWRPIAEVMKQQMKQQMKEESERQDARRRVRRKAKQ